MNILVLEASTSNAKALVYNTTEKSIIEKTATYDKSINQNGRQNPDKITDILFDLGNKISKDKEIDCIALASTYHNLLLCDSNMQPLMDTFTWEDLSATKETDLYKRDIKFEKMFYRTTGCIVHSLYPFFKMDKLLKEQRVCKDNLKILSQGSYIFYKLTQELLTNTSMLSGTGYLNIVSLELDQELLKMHDLKTSNFPEIVDYNETRPLNEQGALKLGLKAGIPVITALPDGALNQIGEGALTEGKMTFSIGTSGALRYSSSKPYFSKHNETWCYRSANKWLIGAATSGASNCVDWYKNNFFSPETTYEDIESQLNNDSFDFPIFMPFLYGERSPSWRDDALAEFIEVKPYHTKHDFYRAILEGVTFNLFECYHILEELQGEPDKIYLSGGVINSSFWLSMVADIFGKDLYITKNRNSSMIGAIVVAMETLGVISSISEFKPEIAYIIKPDRVKHEQYKKRFEKYITYKERGEE